MVNVVTKNIWDNSFIDLQDLLVNPVNCVGVSGKGFAKECKIKFPKPVSEYEKACSTGKLHLGDFLKVDNILFIPTKNHWTDKYKRENTHFQDYLKQHNNNLPVDSEYYLLYKIFSSFYKFENYCYEHQLIYNIHMPLIGCGEAGANPENLISMMKYFFNSTKQNYIIYDNRHAN